MMINRAMTQVRFKRRPGLKRYADDGATLPPSPVFLDGLYRCQALMGSRAITLREFVGDTQTPRRRMDLGVVLPFGWRQGNDVARPKPGHPLRLTTPEGKFFETYQRKRFPKP
ncbi:hypothetical protein ACTAQJ_20675 [Arthrobacter sp. alpha11c]